MRRREFIKLLGGAAVTVLTAWPLATRAQESKPALVGILQVGSAASTAYLLDAFRDAMRQLGYIEGRNVRFEYRFSDGLIDRLPGLAAELVALNPNVILSAPLPASLEVQKATSTIPIVMGTGADPVGFGLVKSLAHPGGNITGVANFAEQLASKQLDRRAIAASVARWRARQRDESAACAAVARDPRSSNQGSHRPGAV